MEILLVLTSLPDQNDAKILAKALVEERLAACVNILPPCCSIYRWHNVVETASEIPLLIKTTQACYPALEAAIHARHPYQTPEIIALPINQGLPDYLAWIVAETQNDRTAP